MSPAARPDPPDGAADGGIAVLVPVKAFHAAKVRLAGALSERDRAELARRMATHVVRAARPLPVSVVCDDDEVARWAAGVGAEVIWRPGRGLNGAVTDGVAQLHVAGFHRVIVAHADLPHAVDIAVLGAGSGVTLVPDRREDGTNIIALPTACGFTFAYGPGSFRRHLAEAERLGLAVQVEREPRLAWDVDVPADLVAPDWAANPLG